MLRLILRNQIEYGCWYNAYSRRFLRRRGEQKNLRLKENEVTSSNSLPSSAECLAAPESSLDSIRAEIARMRLESDLAKNITTNEKTGLRSPEKATEVLSSNKVFVERTNPNEAFWKENNVLEGVRARDRVLRRKLFLDAEEILRKQNKEDTLHYLELAYGCIGSHRRAESLTAAKELAEAVNREITKIQQCAPFSDESGNLPISDGELKHIAWVNVLSNKTDDELYKFWKWGILDLATIEGLSSVNEERNRNIPAVVSEVPSSPLVGESTDTEKENNEEGEGFPLSIEQNIETLKDIEGMQEIMSCLRESMFLGAPSIDLAPTLQRVQQKQYEDISEAELRMLERYEEKAKVVKVSLTPNISEKSLQTQKESNTSKLNDTSTSSAREVRDLKKAVLSEVELTESTIDSALCPSNSFLYAVSRYDEHLRRSFESMERIKRLALFDPEFQAAMKQAHTMEELSVRAHLHGDENKNYSKYSSGRRDRSRRAHSAHTLLGGPLAKAFHSADIPFFFGSHYSFVPPRGRYNLPAPRLSREAISQQRRSRKKITRMRYAQ